MSTAAAAAAYEAQHVAEHAGLENEVYNPLSQPIDDLPIIFGFNNGGRTGWMDAVLISEAGEYLGGHCCSSEGYMPADLGILRGTRPDRHEVFRAHYPGGYRMEFVGYASVPTHARLNAALALHESRSAAITPDA